MNKKRHNKCLFLSGDEALAQGAFESGLRVAASYPGTPATEILEYLSRLEEVDAQWSVNEKVAFEVAFSSSIAGMRSLFSAKHVGINVAMDALMTSAYMGVYAGFIIVSCDDPGLHSSQNEQDNRLIARVAKIPLLEPSSPREAREAAKEAFKISEEFDIPVMIRLTTRISHTKENIDIGNREESVLKDFRIDPSKYVMVPKNAYARHMALEERLVGLARYCEKSPLNRMEISGRKIGFIASGVSYLYAKEMYPDVSFLKLGFTNPFPAGLARRFSREVKEVFVVEELEPYLEEQLKIAGIKAKFRKESFRTGELRPEHLPFIVKGKDKPPVDSGVRKPVMCPGCSHRPVFWTLKKLKLTVTGDIGCYTLGALPPLSSLHTCLCMGAGVTFFEGLRKRLGKQVVGVVGDSTFVHSGITGLINLSYNNNKGVLIILDNSTTAMTGSQPHPATGVTAKGKKGGKLSLEGICAACGADNVDVINPYDIEKFECLLRKRVEEDALSVVIARHPCRLIERKRKAAPLYREDNCRKCYLCLAIDCPAISKNEQGFVEIRGELCTGCNLCVHTCKFQALIRDEKERG